MKNISKTIRLTLAALGGMLVLGISACGGHDHPETAQAPAKTNQNARLDQVQMKSLDMKVDTILLRNMTGFVEASGELEVPPQGQASVTAIVGGNIASIKVIEGQQVRKGQVLATLRHPDIIQLQTDYVEAFHELAFLKEEFERQEKLFEEKVGAGRELQKSRSEYQSMQGKVKGYEAQLRMLGLNLERLRNNELYEQIPVITPISGHVRLVEVKLGQYVDPQTDMFEIVNIDHIHSDLMVFEKDVHKVKEGQEVLFTVQSLPGEEMEARISSVGKAFEQDPKAVHLHTEIEKPDSRLIPGLFVHGRILTENVRTQAVPEDGLVREGDKYYLFTAQKAGEAWEFSPLEVIPGVREGGWVEVKFLDPVERGQLFAQNNAYFLLAEQQKESGGDHDH